MVKMSSKLSGMYEFNKLNESVLQFYENQKKADRIMKLYSEPLSSNITKMLEGVTGINNALNKITYPLLHTQRLLDIATAHEITSISDKMTSMTSLSSGVMDAFSKFHSGIDQMNKVWKDAYLELNAISKTACAFYTFNEKLRQSMIFEIPRVGFYGILEFNDKISKTQALRLAENNIRVLKDATRIDEKLLNGFGESVRESLPQLERESDLAIVRDRLLPCENIPINKIVSEADEMTRPYKAQYVLENYLRLAIGKILVEKYGNQWLKRIPKEIRKECRDNMEKRGNVGIPSPEVFLGGANYTCLGDIILHNAPDFGLTTLEKKNSFKVKMGELSPLRIDIGHVRYLDKLEQQRLEVYVFDLTGIQL